MHPGSKFILEICAASTESAIAAERGGADRIELVSSLVEGGVTPSAGTIMAVRSNIGIALFVIIRPRGGDFCYSGTEFEVMKEDIRIAKGLGADGIVSGILRPDGRIDRDRTAGLIELAKPLGFTFHRAFDMTADPFEALTDLIEVGAERVLTSGQKNKAHEGAGLIKQLIEGAGDRIAVMAGSGITEQNIAEIVHLTNAKEFHATLRKKEESPMLFRRQGVFMGGLPQIPEFETSATDAEKVRKLVSLLNEKTIKI